MQNVITTELENATAQRDEARAKFNSAKPGSKKWREAEEDLNFWQGKVAFLQAQPVTTKPTVRSNDVAAMRALQQWDKYQVEATSAGWTVKNTENGEEYHVTVDGRCDCPHAKKINPSGACCKHFSRADLAERMGQVKPAVPASAPRSYDLSELPSPTTLRKKSWSEMTREEKALLCSNGCDF